MILDILYKQRELDYRTATSPLIYTGIIQLVLLLVSLFSRSQVGVLHENNSGGNYQYSP